MSQCQYIYIYMCTPFSYMDEGVVTISCNSSVVKTSVYIVYRKENTSSIRIESTTQKYISHIRKKILR
jgi:hypothetical protein